MCKQLQIIFIHFYGIYDQPKTITFIQQTLLLGKGCFFVNVNKFNGKTMLLEAVVNAFQGILKKRGFINDVPETLVYDKANTAGRGNIGKGGF